MKKLIFCLFFPFCVLSQDIYFDEPYFILKEIEGSFKDMSFMQFSSYFYDDWEQKKAIKDAKVKEIKIKRTNKKGKVNSTIKQYNRLGNFTYGFSSENNFEEKKEYLNDSLLTYRSLKSKRNLTEYKISYAEGKKVKQQKFKNGKLVFDLTFEYTPFGKMSKSSVSKKGKTYEMRYQYNSENKLEKSTYLINNKEKRVWNHDCKPEGEALKNPKVEVLSSVCVYREESNDGSYAIFERKIRNKKPYLLKKCYDKDSVFLGSYSYIKDTILYHSEVMENNCFIESHYKTKSQKIHKQTKHFYENKHIIEYQWIKKGKLKYRSVWERDQNGFILALKRFNKDEKVPNWVNINRANEKNLIEESSYERKGKTYSKNEMSYSYFDLTHN
jgi:antitoxin component YwqK of YwqJK toxin-antitoxin module